MAVIRYTFLSSVLGEQVNTIIILPSFEPWRDHQGGAAFYGEYPKKKTVYVLHGGSDDSTLYLRRTRLEEYAMERDLAVVMPEVRNSFYGNMVHGKKYFDFISEELPRVMENVFPLSNKREDRYVLGNSMGSHGALKWALNRPDFFAAATGMSGAGDLVELGFYDTEKPRVISSFGTVDEYRNSMNDFKYLVRKHLEAGTDMPRFYCCCGKQDGFYAGAKKFAEYANEQGLPILFEEGEGAHTWEFWDHWIPIMLDHMMKGDR